MPSHRANRVDMSSQAQAEHKKLRRKYRKLKQDSSRVLIEQAAETEKLKFRIHEL